MDDKKTSLNTHDYDTHLSKVMMTKRDITTEENELFLKCILEICTERNKYVTDLLMMENVRKSLILLVHDSSNNYDDKNKIRVELLLPKVWENVKKGDESLHYLFYEQISDIVTAGPCSQGRTTRLIQFLNI